MPNWTNYTTVSNGTAWDDTPDINIYPQNDKLIQQIYEEYMQLEEDKIKYPLLFLKEGIV